MKFHIITHVWGARHTALFLKMTLPNVLSSGNLPSLVINNDVRYRIYTTPADQAEIEASEQGRSLAKLMPVDFCTPLGTLKPEPFHHVHFNHRSATEAKLAGAIAVFVAPDSLWSDGTFHRCGEVMARGYKAIATPFLQVVAESCIPEALETFGCPDDGTILIPPSGLYDLGRRHLHPLTALAMPRSPHGRPALDMIWPVPGEGFVSRFALRELFAFDPRRCPITFLWYAGGAEDDENIYLATGPEDMAMLSVDPLDKYHDNYIVSHKICPGDLVRSTLHPWNVKDQNQTRVFSRRRMYWRSTTRDPKRWRRAESRSDLAMREVEVRSIAQRLWALLYDIGCTQAAGVLAVALEATPLARRWSANTPLTIFVPSNEAFAAPKGNRFAPTNTFSVAVRANLKRLRSVLIFAISLLGRVSKRLVSLLRRIARRIIRMLHEQGLGNVVSVGKQILKSVGVRRGGFVQATDISAMDLNLNYTTSWLDEFLAVGAEPALIKMLRRHTFAGEVGSEEGRFLALEGSSTEFIRVGSDLLVDGCKIVNGPFRQNGLVVWVVDGVFTAPS
jgi:hypothetical protein